MRLLCMSFDGEYQLEKPIFDSIEKVWNYANGIGSKWYFYPFHFVVTDSGKTIKDTPFELEMFKNKKIKTVQRILKEKANRKECQNMNLDEFITSLRIDLGDLSY